MADKELTADWLPLDVQDALHNLEPEEQQTVLRYIDGLERDLEQEWHDVVEASRRMLKYLPPIEIEQRGPK